MIPYLKYYDAFLKKNLNNIFDTKLFPIENCNPKENKIFIKHDVECRLDLALEMAKVEANNGITSIWLLQKNLLTDENILIIKKLIDLGHIIGYHYDVLDSNNGNFEMAKIEFEEVLSWFNQNVYKIKYVCPHGNPSKIRIGYESNKDFWTKFSTKYDLYDLVMDYSANFYSDVSYGYYKITRSVLNKNSETRIKSNFKNEIYEDLTLISIHSHRWSNFFIKSLFNYYFFISTKFVYQKLMKIKFINFLGNKLYKFSKYL